jgi:hypothetical protein
MEKLVYTPWRAVKKTTTLPCSRDVREKRCRNGENFEIP